MVPGPKMHVTQYIVIIPGPKNLMIQDDSNKIEKERNLVNVT